MFRHIIKKIVIVSFIMLGILVPPSYATFIKLPSNPVLDLGISGSWDDHDAYLATVQKINNTFYMWYTGNDDLTENGGKSRIGLATSTDGISWTKSSSNPVLDPGPPGSWDERDVTIPYVLIDGGTYYIWYQGKNNQDDTAIGLATSTDGINWTKSSSNPVLSPGPSGFWDDARIADSKVFKIDDTFYMGYAGFDATTWRIGYATSTDGINWTKLSSNPVLSPGSSGSWDDTHVTAPVVLKMGSTYYMWYSGHDGAAWRIGIATSTDGINWTRASSNPVLDIGASGSWEDIHVFCPAMLEVGSTLYMWYSGVSDSAERIGLATEELPDISANPVSKDFGIVAVNDVSPSQIFTISNNGTADLVIGSVYLTGTNPFQFSMLSENCSGLTIAPSGSCTMEAQYVPTKTGTMYAEIDVNSNDLDTPTLYINLTGTGVDTAPPVSDPNGPYTGTEGQSITLDGSGSTDSDGTISLYEWDIDNDGTFDYSSSLATQSHTYAQQGTYTINLRVTDDLGAKDEATTTATISDTSPTADFTGSPTSGLAPLTVNFTDNSTGYDQPLSYEWDFENDGVIDSIVQSPSNTYNTAGTYTVSLTATDSDGSPNTLTMTDYITVNACPDPVRILGASPVYYSTLQVAYDAAVDGDVIQSQDVTLTETLNINLNKSVTLQGGYDCDYTTVSGVTTINGTMTVSDGTLTVENFVVE